MLVRFGYSQDKVVKLTNRNKGTYSVLAGWPSVKDTTQSFLDATSYELNGTSCKKIYAIIKLNGKKYKTYFEEEFPNEGFFIDSLKPGYYKITARLKGYYPVTTELHYFYPNTAYSYRFYLVKRKR